MGDQRDFYVYTPPAYDPRAKQTYPVLYLLHGSDYNERDWVEDGLVGEMLDNLIAVGRARPMIVVMPIGYSRLPIAAAVAQPDEYEQWAEQVLHGLLPWTERTYGTATDRAHRAVAGLSMGGQQALHLGLGNPALFAWVGAFSSGVSGLRNYPAAYAPTFAPGAPRPELVFLGCGQGDKSRAEMRKTYELLTADGLPTAWREVEGRHTWRVWRQCLADLLERLFPAPATP